MNYRPIALPAVSRRDSISGIAALRMSRATPGPPFQRNSPAVCLALLSTGCTVSTHFFRVPGTEVGWAGRGDPRPRANGKGLTRN